MSTCLFPPRLHATHLDFLTSSFNRAHPWGSCLLCSGQTAAAFQQGSLLLSHSFYFGVRLALSSKGLIMSQPSLTSQRSQGCLTNDQHELISVGPGRAAVTRRGTATFRATLRGYGCTLCIGLIATPALLCSLSQVALPTVCLSPVSRQLTRLT